MRYMQILRFLIVLLIFSSCSTSPELITFYVSEGVNQYFLPPLDWTAANSKAKLDITYRTGTNAPATVNISFYGKKTVPVNVKSVFLHTTEKDCMLEYLNIILENPDKKELRVSFSADRDDLVSLLKSRLITLSAEVDGIKYNYSPDKNFSDVKNKFLAAIK